MSDWFFLNRQYTKPNKSSEKAGACVRQNQIKNIFSLKSNHYKIGHFMPERIGHFMPELSVAALYFGINCPIRLNIEAITVSRFTPFEAVASALHGFGGLLLLCWQYLL